MHLHRRPPSQFIFLLALGLVILLISPASAGSVLSSDNALQDTIPVPARGHEIWHFTTGKWISSSPSVFEGAVYTGSEDGYVYAVDADSGKELWKYQTGSYVSSSPKIAGGRVYIGSGDKNLYCLDAKTGDKVWAFQTGASLSSSPVIANGTVYVGSEDKNLYALSAESGSLLWNFPTGAYIHSSPAVSGGNVYIGSYDNNVYALDARTGKELWRFATGDNVLSSPAVSGGVAYIGSYDHNVYALNADTGAELWRFATGDKVLSSPAVSGKTIVIGSGDKNVYCLDAKTGSLLWSYATAGAVESTPLVEGGFVYVGSGDKNLYAISATNGKPAWSYPTGDNVYSSPAIAGQILFVGSYDHNLYALSNQPPVADFSGDITDGTTPLAVQFRDRSTGSPTAWFWDFGDGENSTSRDPVHTYLEAGTMTVSLTATNGGGSNSTVRPGYISTITILPPPPVADFTADSTFGYAPMKVKFTDTSTGSPKSWSWDFGDGNSSTRENPVYTYPQAGTYTVTLTAKNRGGSSTKTLETPVTVRAKVILPGPDFSVNASTGTVPLAVQFRDRSTGPGITAWAWDFNNDSTIDSTEQDPVCVYKRSGNYTVNLSTTNTFGTKTISRKEVIRVGSAASPVAFTANKTSGIPPLAVQFQDTTSVPGITAWAWDFNNDGSIDSSEKDPVCVYNLPGNFTVSLSVTNASGTETNAKKEMIQVTSQEPVVAFTANPSVGVVPLSVQFTGIATGSNITEWKWDFNNDGTIDSTEQDPVCIYKLPGTYNVSLTGTNAYGTNTSSRTGFVTVTNGAVTGFSANVTSGPAPLAVQFRDTSAGTNITGWKWDFDNDGTIDSTEQDPLCVYRRPGNYTVSLTSTTPLGTSTTSRAGFILVNSPLPLADFTANSTTGIPPLAIQFSDRSTGANITGWAWDFNNDGTIDSTDRDPVCVYSRYGNVTVSLRVTSTLGTNTTTKKDFVIVSSGVPRARFAINQTTGSAPLAVGFRDISLGENITRWAWDFNNDGSIDSTEKNPMCVYNLPGTYGITFTATNAYGSDTIVRKGFVTVT